jgi:flagellar biosynthesis chaperone FliJ
MNEMRKLINLCERVDNEPISEAEEWKEAYTDMAEFIKKGIAPAVMKNGEAINQLQELLKEQAQFLMEIGETLEQFRERLEQIEARGSQPNLGDPGRIH